MAFLTTLALAGAAATVYGTMQQTKAARQHSAAQQRIAEQEQAAEAARQRAMELDARRRQKEIIRNQQRARSLSLATTTAQGAAGAGSSALGGAYGQISGDALTNLMGVSQNLEIGRSIFGANQSISGYRSQIAGYQSDAAFGHGLTSLGGAVLNNLGTVSALGKGFGNTGSLGEQSYGAFIRGLGRGPIY